MKLRRRDWVGAIGQYLKKNVCFFVNILLLVFSFVTNTAWAINSPTITSVQGISVVPDSTIYVSASNVTFKGNAESGTEIRLIRNGTQITSCTTDSTGVWTVTVSSHPQGAFDYTAVAYDGIFLSEPCVAVKVTVDTTPPYINIFYGNAGCRSLAKYQCQVGLFYSTVSDSLSGIDFTTATYDVEYADMPMTGDPDDYVVPAWTPIPGTITNNGTNQVNFYPDDWNLVRQAFRKIRITSSISDKAGNNISQVKMFYMSYNNRPPAPVVNKIWDPGHNIFTGTGEPVTNLPDAEGWVDYYPNMTVVNNPIKVKGTVAKWNLENKGWYAAYMGDETNIRRRLYTINQTNGEFEIDFTGYPHPAGSTRLDIRAGDSADCLGRSPFYVDIVTLNGTPKPATSWTPSGEPAIIGSRLWPTITGKVQAMSTDQTVQIGWGDYSYNTWAPRYSQVVKPAGFVTAGTPGAYDDGDVWYDANDNGVWDTGEDYYDMPSITSDGVTFTIVNFQNVEFNHNTLSYLAVLSRNNYGKSSARRIVRAHNNDTFPPLLNEVSLLPAQGSPYRKSSARPTTIVVKAQTWGGDYNGAWSWSGHYHLNGSLSTVTLTNGQGTNIPVPSPSWVHLGKLAFQTEIDISAVSLPEGTYSLGVQLEDNLTNRTTDNSNWFKIDDTPPNATDMVPADGALSNTFTSFNARIVDPNLADGSAGSGANIDVSKPQIWPYKIISIPGTVTLNGRTAWTFTIADGELTATDHRGTPLNVGDSVEIWETSGGVYSPNTVVGTISSFPSAGQIKVAYPGTYTKNKTYVIMFPIPFFTSNNGVDRVGAVPVSQITSDGTYVTKVITRDKADNTGTFFTTSSPLEIPVGLITYTFDQPFLFAGLNPPDVGTYTTSPVQTRKLNPVQDGQPLSLVQTPNNLASIVPSDANGIPGDGHQVLFGQNGATPGSGQACFGVKATGNTGGSLTVFGVIGLASGTSDPLNIISIDNFTLSPLAASIDITPANPDPSTRIISSILGHAPRIIPDGTLATWTTDFGILATDESADPGFQTLSINGTASALISSSVKGTANVTMQIGGKSATAQVTFLDKYPPPAPADVLVLPQYSNTGASTISWLESVDKGGAGTLDYIIEQSANGGPFVVIGTSNTLTYSVSGLADGSYVYRVKARDADGNVGSVSGVSQPLIVDTVAPPAADCSDIGPGNTDPDEHFSVDPNVYFYYSPSDDRSGVGDIQVQVSITPDTSGLVYEPWIGPLTPYIFPDGIGGNTYYARVRVKDRAGNIGPWGAWSNGIFVNITGAVTPPNAPTITKIHSKNAVPGVPVSINITNNILVEGLSEASNLIEIHIDGVYQNSIISDGSGNFSALVNLTAGTHSIKARAHNGFAGSGFSNVVDIIVDITNPAMTKTIYDIHGFVRGERYIGTTKSAHLLGTIDFYLSDTGGSGFDINSTQATLTDIDDSGNPIPPVATYTNPVSAALEVIAADRVRLVPTVAWKDCLQNGHRYRLNYQVSDFAGNTRAYNFDFVVDDNLPGEASGIPAPVGNENPNIKTLYVYNLETIPWPNWPTPADLVPFVWNESENAYMLDPDYVNPALVDWGTTPHSLLFNTIGFYGTLYSADQPQPPTAKGYDSRTSGFHLAWGYGSQITMGANTLGDTQSFRFPFRTLVNGYSSFTLVDQDWAICRTNKLIKFWINSPNPAPSPPISVQFSNAADPSITYPTWYPFTLLFGSSGGIIRDREVIITDNSNAMLVIVTVPAELFDQTVEIYQQGVGVVASATVSPGNTTAILTLDQTTSSGTMIFQIRTLANGYYSTNLPRYLSYWWYYWVKGDTTSPETFEAFPVETNYNALSGPDARPFPSTFSVKARDTADGSVVSFLEISKATADMQDSGGTSLGGTLNRDYIISNTTYGFRYQLASIPTSEGTYYYRLTLSDASRPTFHTTNAEFPFRLDTTPPIPVEINPGDGIVTNSLPSFNAKISDPLLADGTPGSGPNMDPSRPQIFPFKKLGQNVAATNNSIIATILGIDTIATDHVDKQLPLNTPICFARDIGSGKLEYPESFGVITANGGDSITATLTSGSPLTVGQTYAILYEIPNFPSNDGIDRIAAVPIQPAIKGGSYVVFLKLIDNSLNQGTFSSASSIYEAAYGPFDLFPARSSLYVGLYPPHTCDYVSSAILTTEGNPINLDTEVTLLTNLGSFSPADSNGIPGDGHQVKADAAGKISFGLQATGLYTGLAKVRAVLGLASGTDQTVSFIQIPAFSVSWSASSIDITPLTPNPSISGTTSAIGNAGDLVPNGTCLNIYTDLGMIGPADAYAAVSGHQVPTSGGTGTFFVSSADAGVASVSIEVGGRWVTKTLTFVDKYPPNAPGTPSLDNTLNNNGVFNLIWTAATDPANSGIAEYSIESSLNGGPYTFLASSTTSSYLTSGLPQGVYKFRIRAMDGAGNVGAYSGESVSGEVDATPPLGSILVNSGSARTSSLVVSLDLSATDANGVADMSFSNDGVTWGGWIPYTTSSSWTLSSGDGPKLVYVRYRDNVGNVGVFSDDIILDTTGPLGGITINPNPFSNTTALELNCFANDGSLVPTMEISYDGGPYNSQPFTGLTTWNVAAGYATHTASVRYTDGLGNVSAIYSASTCVDTIAPVVSSVTDDGTYSPWIDKLHATWMGSDGESGISHYLVSVGTSAGAQDTVAQTNVGNVNDITFSSLSLDISGATTYYFTVIAVDRAGNQSVALSSDGIKGGDPTPPDPVTITDDGDYSKVTDLLHATWTASNDPDSGINRYEFSAGTAAGSTDIVNWTDLALALNHTAAGLSLVHGQTYYINVRVWNNGGASTVSTSDGITIDTVPPPSPVLIAEPAYTSGTVNIVDCNPVSDNLSGGVEYYFERATDAGFTLNIANSGWIATPRYSFVWLSHGIKYYFRVKSRDAVQNESAFSGAVSSTQDSNAPTCSYYTDDVPANNDPDHFWSRDLNLNFAPVGLADDLSGVKNVYVQIASENTFSTPLWEGWLNNTTGMKAYVAPNVDGLTIYARAKFEDVAGNISGYYQTDGIRLDLSVPQALTIVDEGAVSATSTLQFDFTHSDAISGVTDVYIEIASNSTFIAPLSVSTWLGTPATTYKFSPAADFSTYWARIKVKDRAGNESAWVNTDGIRVDLSPPDNSSGNLFYINLPPLVPPNPQEWIDEQTTSTSTVYITLSVADPSGIASASISNDGVNWTTWLNPALYSASHSWVLTPGDNTIRLLIEDTVGHVSPEKQKTIKYNPSVLLETGDRDSKIYPVDTYDEYQGQNKYGSDKSEQSVPNEGKSLRLKP
ncbi:MAG: hypothetical protein Kow0029_12010 [Candidatus Rifleibacteriota bacterium]